MTPGPSPGPILTPTRPASSPAEALSVAGPPSSPNKSSCPRGYTPFQAGARVAVRGLDPGPGAPQGGQVRLGRSQERAEWSLLEVMASCSAQTHCLLTPRAPGPQLPGRPGDRDQNVAPGSSQVSLCPVATPALPAGLPPGRPAIPHGQEEQAIVKLWEECVVRRKGKACPWLGGSLPRQCTLVGGRGAVRNCACIQAPSAPRVPGE